MQKLNFKNLGANRQGVHIALHRVLDKLNEIIVAFNKLEERVQGIEDGLAVEEVAAPEPKPTTRKRRTTKKTEE